MNKLNQSVFENVPGWVQWAALQPDGKVAFSDKPMVVKNGNWWEMSDDSERFMQEWPQVEFSRDGWQNSLIERQMVLDVFGSPVGSSGDDLAATLVNQLEVITQEIKRNGRKSNSLASKFSRLLHKVTGAA